MAGKTVTVTGSNRAWLEAATQPRARARRSLAVRGAARGAAADAIRATTNGAKVEVSQLSSATSRR